MNPRHFRCLILYSNSIFNRNYTILNKCWKFLNNFTEQKISKIQNWKNIPKHDRLLNGVQDTLECLGSLDVVAAVTKVRACVTSTKWRSTVSLWVIGYFHLVAAVVSSGLELRQFVYNPNLKPNLMCLIVGSFVVAKSVTCVWVLVAVAVRAGVPS
jgi:hypothetical protein